MGPEEHFEKIKQAREKDRINRKMARSVSTQPAGNDTELLLDQMSTRNDGLSSSVGHPTPTSSSTDL